MSTTETLIRMANQIARAFAALPTEQAVANTAEHIRLFWDPRMRDGLARYLAAGGRGLDPVALAAGQKLAALPAREPRRSS